MAVAARPRDFLGVLTQASQVDRVAQRVVSLLRGVLFPSGKPKKYHVRQTIKGNASSGVFVENNPARETLFVGYSGANAQRITLVPTVDASQGILLNTSTTPLILTRESIGEIVTAEWFFSGFDGIALTGPICVIERIEI